MASSDDSTIAASSRRDLLGPLLLRHVDIGAEPLLDPALLVLQRHPPRQVRAEDAIGAPQGKVISNGSPVGDRRLPLLHYLGQRLGIVYIFQPQPSICSGVVPV